MLVGVDPAGVLSYLNICISGRGCEGTDVGIGSVHHGGEKVKGVDDLRLG